jgi:hypothetical protein
METRRRSRLRPALLTSLAGGLAAFAAGPVTVGNCGTQVTKPADLTIACGDGNDYLKSIRWTGWSATVARGTGVEEVNDCIPYCAAGKFHSYPVAITLDRVESNRFTRLRLHYSGARPPNVPQDVSREPR